MPNAWLFFGGFALIFIGALILFGIKAVIACLLILAGFLTCAVALDV